MLEHTKIDRYLRRWNVGSRLECLTITKKHKTIAPKITGCNLESSIKTYYFTEMTGKNASKRLEEQVALYKECYTISSNNSIHATLAFNERLHHDDLTSVTVRFLQELADHLCVQFSDLSVFGIMIQRERTVYPGTLPALPEVHAHLIVKSPRPRSTGRTVAKLKDETKDSIQEAMLDDVDSIVFRRIRDVVDLLDYLQGWKNLGSTHLAQRNFILEVK